MIFLIHDKAQKLIEVLKDHQPLKVRSITCTEVFWELAQNYPDEIIGWCEVNNVKKIDSEKWNEIFHHDLIMASYAINTTFLPDSIGYVDQLPFINVNLGVKYPTWLMSTDVGGVKGKVLIKFKELFGKISNFGYLITSIGKLGQQNGLFCYSDPKLIKTEVSPKPESLATTGELFSFVHEHYTTSWSTILLWCKWKYDKNLNLIDYLNAFLKTKYLNRKVDLSNFKIKSRKTYKISTSIDVIIPTMGRPHYLMQVIKDLSHQTLIPMNVIIIEQNPDKNSKSELAELHTGDWPFNIIHKFIHRTGACNARNMALEEVKSDWVFLCDDDNRLKKNVLSNSMSEIQRYGASVLNTAYLQPGEKVIYKDVKQWGAFGSGNSIVESQIIKDLSFSSVFEHGYGEDVDFGMQLRNMGYDIIYNPKIQILHLKAPMGGFREKRIIAWEQISLLPKPSPTLMAYAKKHYTKEQIKGFKVSLYLKFYSRQEIRNPIRYIQQMRKRWKLSEEWAAKLLKGELIIKSS